MTQKSYEFLTKLKEKYGEYRDNDSLLALAEVEKEVERVRELAIYREQPKTQELILACLKRYKVCVEKLTSSESRDMDVEERSYLFATMDWAKFTLAIIGESPESTDKMVDDIVLGYAKKAGITQEIG